MRLASTALALCTTALTFGAASIAHADNSHWRDWQSRGQHQHREMNFQRIATVPNYVNNDDIGDSTVSEIIAATRNGDLLVYTDGSRESIGVINISNPHRPMSFGTLDVGGEPTSIDVLGNNLALIAVNTSPSLIAPSGKLVVIDLTQREIIATHELGGQPDSLKISPDGRYAAIAIENERDEEIVVEEEGGLPQLPAGYLVIVDLVGEPEDWLIRNTDLSGLALYAPYDPEPEFVDINADNEAVVTLQENNHIIIVDLVSGQVTGDFPAGTVDLAGIDNSEDGLVLLTDSIAAVPREPDAVAWVTLPNGGYRIATANEGDLFGGSRGFSLFDRNGVLQYDSGNDFDELAVIHGHYPDDRSENKGSEPESIEFGKFGRDD